MILYSCKKKFKISAVVTTSNNKKAWWPSVDKLCLNENIPLYIYEEIHIIDFLKLKPDWLLLLSWKYIIPYDIIKIPQKGILNLHYGLLPAFRGVYPVNWSIIKGEKVSGFTYHFVNEKIDDGDIFMQVKVPILLTDTARTLQKRIDNTVCEYFDKFIDKLIAFNKKYSNKKKLNNLNKQEYYSRNKFKDICALDLNANYRGSEFLNLLRGLTFLPDSKNAYFLDELTGKKIYISIALHEE